ncbi:MAG: hypothetical protein ABWY05_07230 [Noviherbaspirillum sp.]
MKPGALASMLVLTLGACAIAPAGNELAIETVSAGQPLAGANCTVQTVEGSFNIVTPAAVPARNIRGDLRVVCDKQGYRSSEVLYRGLGYGGATSFGAAGGSGNVGFGLGLGFPLGGAASAPARVLVEMTPL